MKKPYQVQLTVSVHTMADDEEDAKQEALFLLCLAEDKLSFAYDQKVVGVEQRELADK